MESDSEGCPQKSRSGCKHLGSICVGSGLTVLSELSQAVFSIHRSRQLARVTLALQSLQEMPYIL